MSDDFTAALDALERSGHMSERYSEPFVALLPVTGAAVSTLGDVLGSETLSASDVHAARLDELQFDLGEGPCWDSLRIAAPISEPALQTSGAARWPAFAAAARDEPVSSIFAFPMIVGPLKLGSVDLYSKHPVELDPNASSRAAALAAIVGRHVLRGALSAAAPAHEEDANPRSRRVIHQATGVVLAQLSIGPDDALLMIQGHAFATGRSMMDVAEAIMEGRLAFRRKNGRIEVGP